MIKKILNWIDSLVDPLRQDDRLLKQGIKNVFGDVSVRTDVVKWYSANEIYKWSDFGAHKKFLIDNGVREYPTVGWTDYNAVAKKVFWYSDFCRYAEDQGKPIDPQPIRFALLPKLNGND